MSTIATTTNLSTMTMTITDQISSSLYTIRKSGSQSQITLSKALAIGWGSCPDADLLRAGLLRKLELDIRDNVAA